ncbi:hypothetical protein LCGC14_0318770 [marine sediment metagenome]|uniref:Uncharacterized protein n=1 Tax=marine sediment metagenome TaxID=412755 RepID=A0A0F9W7E5_9ZZZZ
MILRLLKIISVLDHVNFIMSGRGDYNWSYRVDVFESAGSDLSVLGDHESSSIMYRLAIMERKARRRWRPGQWKKFG